MYIWQQHNLSTLSLLIITPHQQHFSQWVSILLLNSAAMTQVSSPGLFPIMSGHNNNVELRFPLLIC